MAPRSRASRSCPTASTGSSGRPMMRANTLVLPPGRAARAVPVPARPLAASLSVPSPPRTTTTSMPSEAADRARRVAWPRRTVSASVTSWSADSAFWITTRRRPVTEEAAEFTSSRTRTHPVCPLASPARPRSQVAGPEARRIRGLAGVRFWLGAGTLGAHEGCRLREADPDPADPGALDPETRTLRRDVKLILDESDSYGVEMALQLVDTAGEGSVHLVSMVPNDEVSGLRTALAMGADSATLISDEALAGSDALGTARVLAAAIERPSPTWCWPPPSPATATPAWCPPRWPS